MCKSNNKIYNLFILSLAICVFLSTGCEARVTEGFKAPSFDINGYNGGFFSIDKPSGWNIYTAGACSTFSFLIQDPAEPLRQIFHFGQIGPVYLYAQQKQVDMNYMNMGGYPVAWVDMPVINPLTPSTFMENFQYIANTSLARSFMPNVPVLENLQVISSAAQSSLIPQSTTALVRGVFTQNGRVGEGLFMLSTAPLLAFTGGPGGGIGYGFLLTGITAPKEEFKNIESILTACAASFNIGESYIQNCIRQQNEVYQGILKAGKTLSEASDIITRGWEERNKTYDIISEKRSDAIMGRERLYDPSSGEVYEFEDGFYDNYNINREKYEMNDLEEIPDDNYDLWMRAPVDGTRNIR